jgi:hypothetical protein
VLTLSLA